MTVWGDKLLKQPRGFWFGLLERPLTAWAATLLAGAGLMSIIGCRAVPGDTGERAVRLVLDHAPKQQQELLGAHKLSGVVA